MSEDTAATTDSQLEAYVREALRLNGMSLSEADLAATIAEFHRVQGIVAPLLRHELPDRLDLAPVFRP